MRRYRVWPLFNFFLKTKYILALFFRWGIKCEPKAIRKLESYLRENGSHSVFHLQSCGLHISITHPFIAASPDALLICSCNGKIVIVLRSADANRGRYPDEGGKRGVFPFVGWQTRGVADGQASRSSDKTDMTYIQHTRHNKNT